VLLLDITTEIITIASRKGGTGKTTTAFNLAFSLTEQGREVLLVDMDSQANLTSTIEIIEEVNYTIYDVITENVAIEQAIYETNIKDIDIIPASLDLANLEIEISDLEDRELLLSEVINDYNSNYDYIIIDTAPALDLTTINALSASNSVIATVRPSMYSFQGLEQLIDLVNLIKANINPDLDLEGILVTQVDRRTRVAKEFINDLSNLYQDKVFDISISQNIAVVEATIEGIPVYLYDSNSIAAKQYLELASEKNDRDILSI
jgi:chromosome partitioning protein